ncbi:PIN domain-containing protein [Candidatus Curtissbacteria bacterium]|nr:PIN domain-containing protein [Candidatus Curtissbacteria bacterium]
MIFLDTNIILRFVLQDHPIYSKKAANIFAQIDRGKIRIYLSWLVIFEAVFVLQNSHKLSKTEITEKLFPMLLLKNILFENKDLLKTTFEYYVDRNISFADAYHAALMAKKKIKEIYSFDRDFDKFPQIRRLENP